MSEPTEFREIYCTKKLKPTSDRIGKLRIASSGVAWKDSNPPEGTNPVTALSADNIKRIQWIKSARGYQLRVVAKDAVETLKFDGFSQSTFESVRDAARKHLDMRIEARDLSLKGWNWGQIKVTDQTLVFNTSGRPAFEIPFQQISNTAHHKTELTIDLKVEEAKDSFKKVLGTNSGAIDELVELRFYLPGSASKLNEADGEDGLDDQPAAEFMVEAIKNKCDFASQAGQRIASLGEVSHVVPRGRMEVDIFPTFVRLRGKSYDLRFSHGHIKHLFLVPKSENETHMLLILGVEPPLRQGQTNYPFMVMQFPKEEESSFELFGDAADLRATYGLEKHYEGPVYEAVSQIFKSLSRRKILTPSPLYEAADGTFPGLKCSYKAQEGHMFPLEKSFLWNGKPPMLFFHHEITDIMFSRVDVARGSGKSKTFDLTFHTRVGNSYQFNNVPREDYEGFVRYCINRKIKYQDEVLEESDDASGEEGLDAVDDDTSDEDYSPGEESDGDRDYSPGETDEDFASGDDQGSSESEEYRGSKRKRSSVSGRLRKRRK